MLKDIDNHFEEIIAGKYRTFDKHKPIQVEKTYDSEKLNAMFDNISYDDM